MLNNSIYAILTTTDIKLPKAVFRKKKHRLKNFNEKKIEYCTKNSTTTKKHAGCFSIKTTLCLPTAKIRWENFEWPQKAKEQTSAPPTTFSLPTSPPHSVTRPTLQIKN